MPKARPPKTSRRSPPAYRLLVIAHPDDETIFFSGPLMRLRTLPWKVICLTDGNADGRGEERHREFLAATRLLGVTDTEWWGFPDLYPNRLPVSGIVEKLRALPVPEEIFTHGPLGEYGHPHHQDACLAVHRAFPGRRRIHSPAWNCRAELVFHLSPAEFRRKTKAFAVIYAKETSRFVNILPNMAVESFRRFRLEEVEALTGFLRREQALNPRKLHESAWVAGMLPGLREKLETRLF